MSKVKKSSNPYYYKDVAKQLGVRHLFGRWGIQFTEGLEKKYLRIRLVPLDGWTFDSHEIIEAIANDPELAIKYEDKK